MTKQWYLCVCCHFIVFGARRGIHRLQWGGTNRGRNLKWRYVSSNGSVSSLIHFQNVFWDFPVSLDLTETTAAVERRNLNQWRSHWDAIERCCCSAWRILACTFNAPAINCPTLFRCLGGMCTLESVSLENWGISLCVKEQGCRRPSPSFESYSGSLKMKNSASPPLTHF